MSPAPANSPSVNRIPNEVFRNIIQYAYTSEPERNEESLLHVPRVVLPPLAASHVCRSWRKVLLLDPIMWSTLLIPKYNLCAIDEFLQRSKSVPLNVSIRLAESKDYALATSVSLYAVFEQICRFKFLQVDVRRVGADHFYGGNRVIWWLLTCLQYPAPKLEVFSFNYGISFPASVISSTFFDILFSCYAPNLKHINYSLYKDNEGMMARPQGDLFRNLTKLSLFLPKEGMNHHHFLDVLESCPGLTMLYVNVAWAERWLHDTLPVNPLISTRQSKRRLRLPRLQILVLKTHHLIELLNWTLEHVIFPQNVQWYIVSRPMEIVRMKDKAAIHQFLAGAHFSSVNLTVSVDEDTLDLNLVESDVVGNLNGNKFIWEYDDTEYLKERWGSLELEKMIDTCQVVRLELLLLYSNRTTLEAVSQELKDLFHTKFTGFKPLVPRSVTYRHEWA